MDRAALQAVEVTARFDHSGRVTPVSLVSDGRRHTITDVGRRWSDELGLHILVMLPGMQARELIFRPEEARWFLKSVPGAEMYGAENA